MLSASSMWNITLEELSSDQGFPSVELVLSGGKIAPNQDIEIRFDKLLENVVYEVQCDVTSDRKTGQDNDYISLFSRDHNMFPLINGYPLNLWQAKISAVNVNHLNVHNVKHSSTSLGITNLDDTDTITVSNCYALPQT